MRAFGITAAVAGGMLILVGCGDSGSFERITRTQVGQPNFTVQEQDRMPLALTMSSCDGEVIPLEGTSHLNVHGTRDKAGGNHFLFEWNAHLEGIGSFGTAYVMNANEKQDVNSTSGGAQNMTLVFDERVISRGDRPNFIVGFLVHVTMNANGEMTSQTFEPRTRCEAGHV